MKISAIKIINDEGRDFAYFTDQIDLYSKLSGTKDPFNEDMEFIEIGKEIQLNNQILKVKDINLKFENIKFEIKHLDKTVENFPRKLIIEVIITIEFIR